MYILSITSVLYIAYPKIYVALMHCMLLSNISQQLITFIEHTSQFIQCHARNYSQLSQVPCTTPQIQSHLTCVRKLQP